MLRSKMSCLNRITNSSFTTVYTNSEQMPTVIIEITTMSMHLIQTIKHPVYIGTGRLILLQAS